MLDYFRRLKQTIEANIWHSDPSTLPRKKRIFFAALQLLYALQRDINQKDITLRAMGLVFTTLLSLVPLLAVSFSVLKAFGVHNQLEPLLLNFLEPIGPNSGEITANIIGFVENMKVGVLGSLGLALLFYTVVSLVQKIEGAFNSIWHNTPTRSLLRRFSDYLSVILIGPVLVFSAIGVMTAMVNHNLVQKIIAIEPFGTLFYVLGVVMPYLLIIGAFTFVYMFIPNTRVKLYAALGGATLSGILWKTAGWGFAVFAASSTKYHAIYSSFAIIILFLIWLYLNWLILLIGAQISFYLQHPQFMRQRSTQPRLSINVQERLTLLIMETIASRFQQGATPPTLNTLTDQFNVPSHLIEEIVQPLTKQGVLRTTEGDPVGYVPGQDPSTMSLSRVLDTIRHANEDTLIVDKQCLHHDTVESLIVELDVKRNEVLGARALTSLFEHQSSSTDTRP